MRRFREGREGRWEEVEVRGYKDEPESFRGVTRQRLFGPESGIAAELRYFEIEPGGWSSLERHEHAHAVMVLRGRGAALVDPEVRHVAPFDLIRVPPRTWHQLRAAEDAPLGFLCLVDPERDAPERPSAEELEEIRRRPGVAEFLRGRAGFVEEGR
ncbi:MAG: cupin domain-containing protein [Gemmatimonadetes bacterium]|nr:cupin domain-containing protein [Gemmatimonadota bacterium]